MYGAQLANETRGNLYTTSNQKIIISPLFRFRPHIIMLQKACIQLPSESSCTGDILS